MTDSTTTPVAAALDLTLEKARRLRRNKTPLALLMLSGGLDSVVLLATLLDRTEFDIHAHHVDLDNAERRLGAERRALEQVFAYCEEHYRPFERSTSGHEFRVDARSGGTDTELTMFTAGRVCHALLGKVDLVVTGHINPGFNELAHGEAVFHACFFNAAFRPQWIRPL